MGATKKNPERKLKEEEAAGKKYIKKLVMSLKTGSSHHLLITASLRVDLVLNTAPVAHLIVPVLCLHPPVHC